MNLFENILKKVSPEQNTQNFLSGFTPSKPDIFTGKTTSEKIASGEIKARQITPAESSQYFQNTTPVSNSNGGIAGGILRNLSKTPSTFDPNQNIIAPMLTPIETGVNKVVGGTKSVVSSGQKELQSRKATRDTNTEQFKIDFIGQMLQEGARQEDIFATLDQLDKEGVFKDKPGMIEGMSQRLYGSLESGINRATEAQASPYSLPEKSLATGLAIPSTLVSAPFNALFGGALEKGMEQLPDEAKQKIAEAGQIYEQFAKDNPRTAFNIRTAGDVATIAPVSPKVRGVVTKPVKEAINLGKKPIKIVTGKVADLATTKPRPVKDIAGNILQPYKGMVENLDDATNGLRRVVDETGVKTDTFEGLLGKIEETQSKYGKMKSESLSQIAQTTKSISAQKALENLDNVYSGVSSKDMLTTQARVKELARKNLDEGLTPLELDEVKILHTKSNNLFNEKGQTTGGFSSDDLRGIRKDLKEEIESVAEANGVKNIREINKVYGELSDARTLAQNQVDNLVSYKGRQIPSTRIQKVADFIMEFPVIKQAFSDPARILASSLFKTLRGDKINPIEVQKRLPGFLKELQKAGMKSGDLKKVEQMIASEIKLLPRSTSAKIPLTPTESDKAILGQSKTGLPLNNTKNANSNMGASNTSVNLSKTTGLDGGKTKPVTAKVVKPSPTPQKSIVAPKKENTPIEQKKSNIRSTEGSNDFVSYFQKDLGDNITKEGLLKFGFTEKQILDNTFDFLKSKDNKLGVSLEDLFAIAKKQKKPLTTPSNAKQQVSKPISGDTIPEGYTKNVFGEIIKKPSNSKGGFIRIPEIGKNGIPVKNPLVEEARKTTVSKTAKELEGKVFYTGQKSDWTPQKLREYNPSTDDSLMYGPGLYLTPDISIAEGYARGGGKVHGVMPEIKNPLTPSMKDWLTFIQKGNGKMKQDFLIRKGYDAVVDLKGKYKQIMIVDPTQVKKVK